jgi:hypothetical protein
MDTLTLDLIATVLASTAAIAATGLAVWFLPWNESDWEPKALPARDRSTPPAGRRPAARALHAPTAP